MVVLRAERLVGAYEEAWDLLRAERWAAMPRNVMLVTGPSRSADIESRWSLGRTARGGCMWCWWTTLRRRCYIAVACFVGTLVPLHSDPDRLCMFRSRLGRLRGRPASVRVVDLWHGRQERKNLPQMKEGDERR